VLPEHREDAVGNPQQRGVHRGQGRVDVAMGRGHRLDVDAELLAGRGEPAIERNVIARGWRGATAAAGNRPARRASAITASPIRAFGQTSAAGSTSAAVMSRAPPRAPCRPRSTPGATCPPTTPGRACPGRRAPGRVPRARALAERCRFVVLDDSPAVDHQHAVELRGLGDVVRHPQQRGAAPPAPRHREQLAPGRQVEAAKRLVEHDQPRVRARSARPTACAGLAARDHRAALAELGRQAIRKVLEYLAQPRARQDLRERQLTVLGAVAQVVRGTSGSTASPPDRPTR